MRNPVMDSDPTRRPILGAVPAPQVTPTTTVGDARRILARTHADALVVADARGRPVGVITAHALVGSPPRPAASSVAQAMDYEAVRIDPGAGERDTMRTYERAAWTSVRGRRPYRNRAVR